MFHVTIDAVNPRRTAQLIAEIIQGEASPFPAMLPASWVATSAEAPDFSVQVLPRAPDDAADSSAPRHVLVLQSELTAADLVAIAAGHGLVADQLDPSARVLQAEDGRRIEIRMTSRRPAQRALLGRLLARLGNR